MRQLLTEVLARDGHGVDAVDAAGAALPLLLKRRYSLLVSAAALDFATEIRSRGFTLPILLLTTSFEDGLETAVLELGRADYLVKPFELEELKTAVERLLVSADADGADSDPRA